MKKTKLNLLTNREDYQRIEGIFFFVRILFYLQIVVLIGIVVIFFAVLINQNNGIGDLSNQKRVLLETLKNKENDEAKLLYLQTSIKIYQPF